jgi:DnaJ family protein C protein 1
MNLGNFLLLISTLLVAVSFTHGFETWELDLFDVVEEVNANFYETFGLKPDCSGKELKKTFRKLSLQWHPDRNQEPGAEKMFRNVS